MSERPGPLPYPPSWIDRLHARIDRLPAPAWAYYVSAWLVLSLIVNVVPWIEGVYPVGTLDPYFNSGPLYVVFGYAAIHFLDRSASRAWWAFWPTTCLDEETARQRALRLTTMPARPVLAWTGLGILVSVLFMASQYGRPLDVSAEPVTLLMSVPFITIGFVGTMVFVYHTLRQLRGISEVHRDVASVDLLHPGPLHAFAGLTAATGLALLVIGYAAAPTNPYFADNAATVATAAISLVLAVASFVVPLWGIHQLLAAERTRRLRAVTVLVDKVMADVRAHVEAGDLADADGLNKSLTSLLAEREVLTRAPTWPWTPDVVRAFATAVVLPIALWVVFRILERTRS